MKTEESEHYRETRMKKLNDDSLLKEIKAGEADMSRYSVMLDAIHREESALAEGDSFVINAPYSHLVVDAIATSIAERRADIKCKFKHAAQAVWWHRTEAKRRGLLSPSGQAVPQSPRPRDDEDPEDDPEDDPA